MKSRLAQLRTWLAGLWDEPVTRLIAVGVVLVPALALIIVTLLLPTANPSPQQLAHAPITVTNTLSPTAALFGDRVAAEIDVLTDDATIDPRSVSASTDFRPYSAVTTRVDRSSHGHLSLARTRIELQCLTSACLPGRERGRVFRFKPLVVSYAPATGNGLGRVVRPWASIKVYSRLTDAPRGAGARLVDAPPNLDTSFGVSPRLLQIALLTLAATLGLIGAALVATGFWPTFFYSQRHWRRLSPLEQALAQLDAAAGVDDEALRRRVLDQLASRLGESGLDALEQRTRSLAWDADPPDTQALSVLGRQIRGSLNGRSSS